MLFTQPLWHFFKKWCRHFVDHHYSEIKYWTTWQESCQFIYWFLSNCDCRFHCRWLSNSNMCKIYKGSQTASKLTVICKLDLLGCRCMVNMFCYRYYRSLLTYVLGMIWLPRYISCILFHNTFLTQNNAKWLDTFIKQLANNERYSLLAILCYLSVTYIRVV